MSKRILIADDHPMIRSAVEMLLAGTEFTAVAHAETAEAAIEAVCTYDPDIIVLDLAMPGGSGITVLRQLRAAGDRRPVIILTAAIEDYLLGEARELAVAGIVLKNSDPAFLLDCLEAVSQGRRWIDPELSERIATLARQPKLEALSPRERELVALVARGMRNRSIAEEIGVTEGTVKAYLHTIFEKTGVASRTELAMRAPDLLA